MSELLVCVDFSKSSINALNYAVVLANKLGYDIMMVWVNKPESYDSLIAYDNQNLKLEIKNRFEELIKTYAPKLKKGTIKYKLRKGKIYQEIVNQAKYYDAQMIVAGTHGVSGFEEYWIGSNAYKIVTYSPCPVITVRQDFKIKETISKIVLPIDSTLETRQKVPFTAQLAKPFDAEIHILALYSSSLKSIKNRVNSYVQQVAKYLDEENISYKIESIEASNITNSTIDYAVNINADLISIMTEQETSTSNIWLGNYAQQMVNHSPIPVISVHPKELLKIFK